MIGGAATGNCRYKNGNSLQAATFVAKLQEAGVPSQGLDLPFTAYNFSLSPRRPCDDIYISIQGFLHGSMDRLAFMIRYGVVCT